LPSTKSSQWAGRGVDRLSEVLCDAYVRPASATSDEQERSRREYERGQLHDVAAVVGTPNLPDESRNGARPAGRRR
jgi:hypothetical protein